MFELSVAISVLAEQVKTLCGSVRQCLIIDLREGCSEAMGVDSSDLTAVKWLLIIQSCQRSVQKRRGLSKHDLVD